MNGKLQFRTLLSFLLLVTLIVGILEGFIVFTKGRFLDIDLLWTVPFFNLVVILPIFLIILPISFTVGRWTSLLGTFLCFFCIRVYDSMRTFYPGAGRTVSLLTATLLAILVVLLLHHFRGALLRNVHIRAVVLSGTVFVLAVVVTLGQALIERRTISRLPVARVGAPNVLLIIVDTLRADHLSCYGYSKNTSPNIDRLSREGVLFENAIAPSSWTLPSHASMLTGKYPSEHHLETQSDILDGTLLTLGEKFLSSGYRTAAFSANYTFFARRVGLGRGFVHFEDYIHGIASIFANSSLAGRINGWIRTAGYPIDIFGRQSAQDVNRNALSWIQEKERQRRPFFVALNYLDTHDPYLPSPEYANLFASNDETGGRVSIQFNQFPRLTAAQLKAEISNYDGSIRYVDNSIKQLLQGLEAHGMLQNTVVVVTSDHGEALGEHGLLTHANALYREIVRVPLIIWRPGRIPANVRVSRPVSTVDLPSTLLDSAGSLGDSSFPGTSLEALWLGRVSPLDWPDPISELAHLRIDPSFPNYRGKIRTLVTMRHQYIRGPLGDQLFDWIADPGEEYDLIQKNPEFSESIRTALNGR